jgi:hypothetical protein
LKTKALIKKVRQLSIPRTARAYKDIHTVLLLWDASQDKSDIEELKTFGHELRKSGKEIAFLVFHPIKKLGPDMLPNEIHKLCCKGDFNFFAVPKSKALKDVLETPYDLLINGCLSDNEYLKTISVFSKAKFRIGPYLQNDDTNFYELLISPNGANPCENYLIEIGKNLSKIQ